MSISKEEQHHQENKNKSHSRKRHNLNTKITVPRKKRKIEHEPKKIKQSMDEKKIKRQQNEINKIEDAQKHILDIEFRENFLTICGSDEYKWSNSNKKEDNTKYQTGFKADVEGLVALCNTLAIQFKSYGINGYSILDVNDPLAPYQIVISEKGARTIKIMMVIVRGGRVVNEKWVKHSIKMERWLPPKNYEWPKWQKVTERALKRIIQQNKIDQDEMVDNIGCLLLSNYSIYVQNRTYLQPSSVIIEHLAYTAGAHIVNKNWENKRLQDYKYKIKRNKMKKDIHREIKLRKYKLIISHSSIYNKLLLGKEDYVVSVEWLYDSIENYKVVHLKKYIVKPK